MKPARAAPSDTGRLKAKMITATKMTVATSARLAALRQVGGRSNRA
jgi:hypothetical protein